MNDLILFTIHTIWSQTKYILFGCYKTCFFLTQILANSASNNCIIVRGFCASDIAELCLIICCFLPQIMQNCGVQVGTQLFAVARIIILSHKKIMFQNYLLRPPPAQNNSERNITMGLKNLVHKYYGALKKYHVYRSTTIVSSDQMFWLLLGKQTKNAPIYLYQLPSKKNIYVCSNTKLVFLISHYWWNDSERWHKLPPSKDSDEMVYYIRKYKLFPSTYKTRHEYKYVMNIVQRVLCLSGEIAQFGRLLNTLIQVNQSRMRRQLQMPHVPWLLPLTVYSQLAYQCEQIRLC